MNALNIQDSIVIVKTRTYGIQVMCSVIDRHILI